MTALRRCPYAAATAAAMASAVALDLAVLRTRLLTQRDFWASYAIMLAGQLVANGVLAGRAIVRYDEGRLLGPRVARAPVEDLGFGFALVTATMSSWAWAGRSEARRSPGRGPRAGSPAPRWRRGAASRR